MGAYSVAVVGVVVRDDGRVLAAQRRDNGRWEPPGGHLEPGETFEAGVAREVREETGVTVEVGPLTGAYCNLVRQVVVLTYRCRLRGGEPGPSDEVAAVAWVTADEARACMPPAFAARVTDALADGPPASRAHDGNDLVRTPRSDAPG